MQVERNSVLSKTGQTIRQLSELPTAELVLLAQAGDREAFDPLYRRYAARILAYAMRRVDGNRPVAEDIVSETWVAALSSIERFRGLDGGEDDFVRWLFGITKGSSLKRQAPVWRELPSSENQQWANTATPVDMDQPAANGEMRRARERLLTALETLAPTQRQVARMRLDGMSFAEIAQSTGETECRVKKAWERARASLTRRLTSPVGLAPWPRAHLTDGVRAKLLAVAETLPPAARRVAQLRIDGARGEDIAQTIGCSVPAVAESWRRARRAFARRGLAVTPGLAADEVLIAA